MGAYIDTNNEFRLIGSESTSLKELTNFLQERCNNIANGGTHSKSSGILLGDDGDGYVGCDTEEEKTSRTLVWVKTITGCTYFSSTPTHKCSTLTYICSTYILRT